MRHERARSINTASRSYRKISKFWLQFRNRNRYLVASFRGRQGIRILQRLFVRVRHASSYHRK